MSRLRRLGGNEAKVGVYSKFVGENKGNAKVNNRVVGKIFVFCNKDK